MALLDIRKERKPLWAIILIIKESGHQMREHWFNKVPLLHCALKSLILKALWNGPTQLFVSSCLQQGNQKAKRKGSHQVLAKLHVNKIEVTPDTIYIYNPAGFHSVQLCHTWRKCSVTGWTAHWAAICKNATKKDRGILKLISGACLKPYQRHNHGSSS